MRSCFENAIHLLSGEIEKLPMKRETESVLITADLASAKLLAECVAKPGQARCLDQQPSKAGSVADCTLTKGRNCKAHTEEAKALKQKAPDFDREGRRRLSQEESGRQQQTVDFG